MRKLLFAAALLGLLFLAAACAKYAEPQTVNQTGIANPASLFCEEQGGTVELINEPTGVRGDCVLEDGTRCDEWAYYRGECTAA